MAHCDRCGAELPPGSLKYLITIHVTADFDGVLPDQGDMDDLEAFMRTLDAADPVEAGKDVYQAQGFLLCPACKASFLADPLGRSRAGEPPGPGGRMH